MLKYADKLDWEYISKYQNLSKKFILENNDKIDFNKLKFNIYFN